MVKDKSRKKSHQQKPPSPTVKTVVQPKPAAPGGQAVAKNTAVNLCDDCAYEFGACDGKPKFASDNDPALKGTEADRVLECGTFVNVQAMPTADQGTPPAPLAKKGEALVIGVPVSDAGRRTCDVEHLRDYPECFEECEKDECDGVPEVQKKPELVSVVPIPGATAEGKKADAAVMAADLEARRKHLQRFHREEEFGNCAGCDKPLKRTAFNRDLDAVRCLNPRCRQFRAIVKTVKAE